MPDLTVLLDQNVPREIIAWLKTRKPDWIVLHTSEAGLSAESDANLYLWATKKNAVIVTFDEDFADRLRREPVSLSRLYLLMASAHLGISKHFVRWLATTVARVSDDRIRSLLAQQLSDELGNGNPDRRHSLLFDRLLSGLEPWAPRDSRTLIEALGHDLQTRAEQHFLSQDPNEAVGALIASEICAEEFDTFLGKEFARQSHLLPRDLAWVAVHTELEPAHAEDSSRIAHFLSGEESLSAALRGAVGTFVTAWTYLDSLYTLCFATPLGTVLREQN